MTELTGRDLDAAVAAVLGWRNVTVRPLAFNRYMVTGLDPADGVDRMCPKYSDPWCSGLAPVLAWLTENVGRHQFELIDEVWYACADYDPGCGGSDPDSPSYQLLAEGPTLPEAAALLLVAWAKRRGT